MALVSAAPPPQGAGAAPRRPRAHRRRGAPGGRAPGAAGAHGGRRRDPARLRPRALLSTLGAIRPTPPRRPRSHPHTAPQRRLNPRPPARRRLPSRRPSGATRAPRSSGARARPSRACRPRHWWLSLGCLTALSSALTQAIRAGLGAIPTPPTHAIRAGPPPPPPLRAAWGAPRHARRCGSCCGCVSATARCPSRRAAAGAPRRARRRRWRAQRGRRGGRCMCTPIAGRCWRGTRRAGSPRSPDSSARTTGVRRPPRACPRPRPRPRTHPRPRAHAPGR
jgi:hypothetical protein